MVSKTGTNAFFSKKLKRNPEALPLMNGGLKSMIEVHTLHNHDGMTKYTHWQSKKSYLNALTNIYLGVQ